MSITLKGIMQAPVTPLKDDFSFDGSGFEKMVDFHVRHGAPAIAWPHHKAESLNLTIAERKLGAEIAVKTVAKRVPVSIFVGTLSEEDSLDLARHARKVGADMILTISPYCRRLSQEETFDSIVRIGTHTDLPVLTYNSPWRNGDGVEFTGELTRRLIERLPNYIGMKDAGFHSPKFLEISRVALRMRPGFSIIIGVEHLLAAYPLGACGSFSSSGAIGRNSSCSRGRSSWCRRLSWAAGGLFHPCPALRRGWFANCTTCAAKRSISRHGPCRRRSRPCIMP